MAEGGSRKGRLHSLLGACFGHGGVSSRRSSDALNAAGADGGASQQVGPSCALNFTAACGPRHLGAIPTSLCAAACWCAQAELDQVPGASSAVSAAAPTVIPDNQARRHAQPPATLQAGSGMDQHQPSSGAHTHTSAAVSRGHKFSMAAHVLTHEASHAVLLHFAYTYQVQDGQRQQTCGFLCQALRPAPAHSTASCSIRREGSQLAR